MPIVLQKQEDELTVEMQGAVTVRHAQDVATQLLEILHGVRYVTVRTVDLEDVDTSILQLLCSVRKTVAALSWEEPSGRFLAAVDRCGLRRELLGGLREGA